jgi:hypothetical protein
MVIWSQLKHPHVIQVYHTVIDPELVLVMECGTQVCASARPMVFLAATVDAHINGNYSNVAYTRETG